MVSDFFPPVPTFSDLKAIEKQKPAAISIPYWWFEQVFSEPRLPSLKAVYLTSFKKRNIDMRDIDVNGVFASVKALQIPFATGVDDGLEDLLKHFPNVDFLELSDSVFGDESFKAIVRSEKIRYLYVSRTRLTSASFPLFEECKNRIEIVANGTPLEVDGR